MNGLDKALIEIEGISMLERVIARLRPQCSRLLISSNANPDHFARLGLPLLADPADAPSFAGPLAGVLAGLDWVAENAPDYTTIITASVDAPFLPDDLTAQLDYARHASGSELAVARSGGRMHPTFALWPTAMRARLRQALIHDDFRKLGLWMTNNNAASVDWPIAPFDPFFNVNTPDDVVEAAAILKQQAARR
jgi:molybdopterin-guanine dinucleotide biosynthesis protein A